MPARVRVLLFARLREICGTGEIELPFVEAATPAECFDRLVELHGGIAGVRESVMVAVNSQYAGWNDRLATGDEVAFIPPVSGG